MEKVDKIGKIYRNTLVTRIKEELKNSKSTFLVSYSALSASQLNVFRKDLKKIGARVYVSKNRIAEIALKEVKQDKLAGTIDRQTAFVWTDADSVEVSKLLVKFLKDFKGLAVQGGLVEGAYLAVEDVKRLSALPSREVLLSQLLTTMISPITGLQNALNSKTRDLLSIMKQLSEKKGGS
jgi:large subunit ribosomal protein L10